MGPGVDYLGKVARVRRPIPLMLPPHPALCSTEAWGSHGSPTSGFEFLLGYSAHFDNAARTVHSVCVEILFAYSCGCVGHPKLRGEMSSLTRLQGMAPVTPSARHSLVE